MNAATTKTDLQIAAAADALMYEYDVQHQRTCKDLDCYRCYDFIAGQSEARHARPRYTKR